MKIENSLTFFSIAFPRRQQRNRRQEAGEHDQQQADAVDADVVVDAERRNPRHALDELELGGRRSRSRAQMRQRHARTPPARRRAPASGSAPLRRPSALPMSSSRMAPASGSVQRQGRGARHCRYLQR